MIEVEHRSGLTEWRVLEQLASRVRGAHLRDLVTEPGRGAALAQTAGPLVLDIGKQRLDMDVLRALIALAERVGLSAAVEGLLAGAPVNTTERRAALHAALRLPREARLELGGRDIVPDVHDSLARVRAMVDRLHSRQWRGFSGRAITDVVNIGVGGSDLGPFMACQALGEFTPPEAAHLRIHFASSIDGTQLADLLGGLRPETTLFIVSSKSFTTIDTLSNAHTALQWLLKAQADRGMLLKHHFIGLSARPERMTAWGIPEANQVVFWEWVGGRFSLWSGIGLTVALRIGMAGFEQMLAGAHFMDLHFRETPLSQNLPVLLGLVGVWNATFLGIGAHAILPYDGRLKYLPSYLSQLEMESNGKSVSGHDRPVDYQTCPILWGEVGPNAQHAFYQLLHQGTLPVSCDFIAPVNRYRMPDAPDEEWRSLSRQHRLALGNCLAQSRVLMLGSASAGSVEAGTPGFKRYHGNQPSTTLLLDELNPYTLGALLALYEHKVFVMSVLWGINPFDQWGVELGKTMADRMVDALERAEDDPALDDSTRRLLAAIAARQEQGEV